jgi:hypothetical protein
VQPELWLTDLYLKSINLQLREISSTTTKVPPLYATPFKHGQRIRKRKKNHKLRPIETFYRRVVGNYDLNTQIEWLHCQDLITPFLLGKTIDLALIDQQSAGKRSLHLMDTVNAKKRCTII